MKNLFADLETRSPVPIKHGTHRYAEEAEVLLWSYALDDGPIDVWDAFNDPETPIDLEIEIDDPDTLVWFHNSQFDFVVLAHAMPEIAARIPQSRRRDTMVQAYCHGLPGKLDTLGEVLNIDQDKRKLKTGKALMRFFCIPQKRDDGSTYWNTRETHPAKWREFMEYAGGDIAAMREVHRKVPKWNYRTGHPEMALWHLDIKINNRGAAVDIPLAHAAVRAAKASLKELSDETVEATNGEVGSATQRDVLLKYILESHGVALPDMRADTLERRMLDENLPPQVRTLLAIRLQASMNSASKYTALLNGVSADGRLRGLAQFCGASRTGRWAHRMFQPGNLMRPPIEVIAEWHRIEKHEVKDHHIESFIRIGIEAMLAETEGLIFGNVRALAGAAVRGTIIAPPGRKLVIADLANIEGRVAAWLAGEEWKLQAFRDYDTGAGPDLYKLAYAKAFNVLAESVSKENRQIGKVCLAEGSLVMTDSGWLPIEQVTTEQKLWDGAEWVSHKGLLSQGIKQVIPLGALYLTPDHSVLCGTQWRDASTLKGESTYLWQALAKGAEHLPSRAILLALWAALRRFSFVATAGALNMAFSRITFAAAAVAGALNAGGGPLSKSAGGSTHTQCLKLSTASDFFNVLRPHVFGVHHRTMQGGPITAEEGSRSATNGSTIERLFSRTFERFKDGITQSWKWTARTLMGTTHRATSASSRNGKTFSTAEGFKSFKPKSIDCEKKMPTYDLACAGPRKRFTVLTSRGPIIVHNCELMFQYQGGVGAWITGAATYGIDLVAMTDAVWDVLADDVKEEARSFLLWLYEPIEALFAEDKITADQREARRLKARYGLSEMTFVACDAIKRLWRRQHPQIESYWKQLENTVIAAIQSPGVTLDCRKLKIRRDGSWLRIALPSGRALCYPFPVVKNDKISFTGMSQYTHSWSSIGTYGGKLFENVVQAVARDVLAYSMPLIESKGYDIVFTVHDEIACEVRNTNDFTHEALAEMMCAGQPWAEGLPLAAAGFSTSRYYKG